MQTIYNYDEKLSSEDYLSVKNKLLEINKIKGVSSRVFWNNKKDTAFEILSNIVQIEDLLSLRFFIIEFWFKYTKLLLMDIYSRYTRLAPDDLQIRFFNCANYVNYLENKLLPTIYDFPFEFDEIRDSHLKWILEKPLKLSELKNKLLTKRDI